VTQVTVNRRLPTLDQLVDARGSLRAMAFLRLLLGVIVIRHLWPDVRTDVVPVDRFYVPWWSWLPVPSPDLYRALAWLGVAAGAAMVVGVATRVSTRVAFVVVTYLVFVDMTGFAHNRAFLVWLLFGLCLLPTGGAFTISNQRPPPTTGFLWPVLMLRVVVSTVYLTSGLTKLANPDWRSGLVLWDRVVRHESAIPFDGWVGDLLTSRAFHQLLAPSAIAVELFLGLALWSKRARLAAIWVAIVFHTSIELAASVQTFSYSAVAALLIWVTPRERDRTFAGSERLTRLVGNLDWLRRFELEPPVEQPHATFLIDRDGTIRRGRDAELTALSRLPVLFPFVAPILAGHRLWHRQNPRRREQRQLTAHAP
jgi:uncharacterized membrane protein YphA (DoxX/SURF4 family)